MELPAIPSRQSASLVLIVQVIIARLLMNQNLLLEIAGFSPSSLQIPNAWCGHLPFAAWLIQVLEPKIFVELGTHTGNSYFSFCQSVKEANLVTKCYAVDTWQGDEHAGKYGDEVFSQVNSHNQRCYENCSRLLRMTFDDAVSCFSNGSIELLHIDGLHTYEAVKHDFETWLPKLAPGAVILFHDTNVRERGFGVWKLWEELQNRYPNNLEFLHSHGLGVLQLDGATDAKKLAWLDANSVEQQQLKNYFSALGARQLERFDLGQTKIQVTNLSQEVMVRSNDIAHLHQAVAERNDQIANLNQVVITRENDIAHLHQVVAERDTRLAALLQSVEEIKSSASWAVTSPFRYVSSRMADALKLLRLPASQIRKCASWMDSRMKVLSWYFQLMRCPQFDRHWYLEHNPDIAHRRINPLWHYVVHGWKENRRPGQEFDCGYYRARYPDIADLDQPPLLHYWLHGRKEGRYMNPTLDMEWLQRSDAKLGYPLELRSSKSDLQSECFLEKCQGTILISVIIPTYNRINLLPDIIDSWKKVHASTFFPYEIIFSDDGSSDGTVAFLETVKDLPLKILRNAHGGASSARNAAIREARGDRLLIIGDDIFPDPEILNIHANLANKLGPTVAVLGEVDWHDDLPVNHLMRHITEIGNEQFSYNRLVDKTFVDFRHFYTCNISVDRHFLLEEEVIFDERFDTAAFEDVELGYRLSLRGLKLYYAKQARGGHYHPYTATGFCRRQTAAGKMAVVFCKIHPGMDTLLSISMLALKARKASKTSGQDEFWKIRIDMLLGRCDVYESFMSILPKMDSQIIGHILSAIYVRLFRAMYEYGILTRLGGYQNPLAISISNNFGEAWNTFWVLLEQNGERRLTLNIDEVRNLAEALNTENSTDLFFGKEQRVVFDELICVKSILHIANVKKARNKIRHFAHRIGYYLVNDQSYLLYRAKQALTNMLKKPVVVQRKVEKPEQMTTSIPAIVVDPNEPDSVTMIALFREIFGPTSLAYERSQGDELRLLCEGVVNEKPIKIAQVNATAFYWPTSLQTFLHRDQLLCAYMALVENDLSLAVISNSLEMKQSAYVGILRDHILFSRHMATAIFNGGQTDLIIRGKILRLLPSAWKARLKSIEELLDVPVNIEEDGFFVTQAKEPIADIRYRAPYLPLRTKTKPIVFVFPIFLAVGGVERNTIEIMRQLRDRFDFVVVTMERLRPEQGSLAAQAHDVAVLVIEMAEIVRQTNYLRVLSRLKASLLPDLVWVCNGSPWFCDNAAAIRQIFHDVPIIDQEVYDVEQGWITRYGEAGIRSFDRFIAVNKKIEERFRCDFLIDSKRIDLIYSAIDTSRIRSFKRSLPPLGLLRAKFGLPEGKQIFTFIGRLTTQKRPLEFLKLAEKRLSNEAEYFVLVGDGELAYDTQNFISKNGLTNVTTIPFIENTLELHAVSNGIIFASAYEGLPIAMIEAIAMGVPAFSTDVGDIADVLTEFGGGAVVPVNSSTEYLLKAFENWMAHRDEYASSLDENEQKILERFSSKSIAQQYIRCWEGAMDQYRRKVV